MKSISMIKEEFKNLTPEQIPAQIALYQEDERKGVQNFLLSQQKKICANMKRNTVSMTLSVGLTR